MRTLTLALMLLCCGCSAQESARTAAAEEDWHYWGPPVFFEYPADPDRVCETVETQGIVTPLPNAEYRLEVAPGETLAYIIARAPGVNVNNAAEGGWLGLTNDGRMSPEGNAWGGLYDVGDPWIAGDGRWKFGKFSEVSLGDMGDPLSALLIGEPFPRLCGGSEPEWAYFGFWVYGEGNWMVVGNKSNPVTYGP
jgi:hypothetical protein